VTKLVVPQGGTSTHDNEREIIVAMSNAERRLEGSWVVLWDGHQRGILSVEL
jgi:hypothetical protein